MYVSEFVFGAGIRQVLVWVFIIRLQGPVPILEARAELKIGICGNREMGFFIIIDLGFWRRPFPGWRVTFGVLPCLLPRCSAVFNDLFLLMMILRTSFLLAVSFRPRSAETFRLDRRFFAGLIGNSLPVQ